MGKFLDISMPLIERGLKVIPLRGKSPFLPNWNKLASLDPAVIKAWDAEYPNSNVGVVATEDYWLLDVDSMEWFMEHSPLEQAKTLIVRTGSGKLHYYFKHDAESGKLNMRAVMNPRWKNKEETPGEELKLLEYPDQVVGPGSVHPETGKPYKILSDLPIASATKVWIEWLKSLSLATPTDQKFGMGLKLRPGLDIEKTLTDAGLLFERSERDGKIYLNYHAKMGKCLIRGESHAAPGEVANPRQCAFVINPENREFWHQCFSGGCQVPGKTKVALEALGLKLSDMMRDAAKLGERSPLVVSSAVAFVRKKFREKEVLFEIAGSQAIFGPFLAELHASRGTGKSNFGFGLSSALAVGGRFLMFDVPKPRRVLYVEGEMDGADLQERMRCLVEESENFNVVSLEDQPDLSIPSIATSVGRALIEEAVDSVKAEFLVLDSISTLANIATNDEEAWLDLCAWMKTLRIKGTSVMYAHHDGKNGKQRGHSKHEDLLDYVMHLAWPSGYYGKDGFKADLTFEKARRPIPDCPDRLSIELVGSGSDTQWVYSREGAAPQSKRGRPSKCDAAVLEELRSMSDLGPTEAAKRLGEKFPDRSKFSKQNVMDWRAKYGVLGSEDEEAF